MIKGKFLFIFGALLLVVAIVPLLRRPHSSTEGIQWHSKPESAFEAAAEKDQAVLTFLYTDWCGYCRQMDQTTFQNASVVSQLGSDYTWLRLNAETDPAGAQMRSEFAVGGFPTLLILDEAGDEIDRLQGYIPPSQFVPAVEDAVSSPSSVGFLREKVEESPEDIEAQYQLAEAYLQRRMYEKAELQLKRVVELDPENESGHTATSLFYLADVHFSRENLGAALETLATLKEKFPENEYAQEADLMSAEILLYTGETDQAKKILAAFLETNPGHPSAPQIREILSKQ